MRIDKTEKGIFGNFKIIETEDKEITEKFIDYETQLLIVVEKWPKKNKTNFYISHDFYYTTVNPTDGELIEVENRKGFINYNEVEGKDEDLGIVWKRKRIPSTIGSESISIEIIPVNGLEKIKTKILFAFSETPHQEIRELYPDLLKKKEEYRIKREKDIKNYRNKNYDERVKFWSGTLHSQMRKQVEWGFDEYGIFTKEWLEKVKQTEPNIERILTDIFENQFKNYWNIDKIKEALKK